MRKTIKRTIVWHPIAIKYPKHMATVLLQTNDGVLKGYWNERDKSWHGDSYKFNSDTHVIYWANWPEGVGLSTLYNL
jgi:hypothetical protein